MSKLEQYITEATEFKKQKKAILNLAKSYGKDSANLKSKMLQDINKILDKVEKNSNEEALENFMNVIGPELDKIDDTIMDELL